MSLVYIVRHGQSEANVDPKVYNKEPNHKIKLTSYGEHQAQQVGDIIKKERSKHYEYDRISTSIYSSPYDRTIHTSNIISEVLNTKPVRPNLLLSEVSCGDQTGCNVESFQERPLENYIKDKVGYYFYKPNQGESMLDLHVRSGLFVVQQKFFEYCGINVIVSHASLCLMLHYFLTGECPDLSISTTKASEYWPTGHVQKYTGDGHCFKYST